MINLGNLASGVRGRVAGPLPGWLQSLVDGATLLPDLGARIAALEDEMAEVNVNLKAVLPALHSFSEDLKVIAPALEKTAPALQAAVPPLVVTATAVELLAASVAELRATVNILAGTLEPLQGTAMRVGRMVDRLPRSKKARLAENGKGAATDAAAPDATARANGGD